MSIATAIQPARAQSSSPKPAARPVRLRAPRGGIVIDGRHFRGGSFLPPSAALALEDLAARAARRSEAEAVVIGIQGFAYSVRSIPIASCIGSHAFELVDADRGRLYHVHKSAAGEVCCDCPDFEFRKRGLLIPCKHGARLVELGLIPTRPTVLPPFVQRATVEAPAADHLTRAGQMIEVPMVLAPFAQRAAVEAPALAQCEPIPAIPGSTAAIAGFERWAADRMATAAPTPAESWRRRGEQLGRSGRLVDLEVAFPDATPREVLLFALDYSEAQWRGFREFARQLGHALGLDGRPADRPDRVPGRFDDVFLLGHGEGSAERRERERIQAEWQAEAEQAEQERWAREDAAEAGGWYRAALARA